MSKFTPHGASSANSRATSSTICQKCLGTGHFTYQCKNARPYVSRPSRTKQLEKPSVLGKLKSAGRPSVDVPDEFKNKSGVADRILEKKEKERTKSDEDQPSAKRTRRSSSSDSSSSSSDSDSDSSSSSGSDSSSNRSRSRSGSPHNQRERVHRERRSVSSSPERHAGSSKRRRSRS